MFIFSPFFKFYFVVCWDGKILYSAGSLFLILFIITRSRRLVQTRWSVCISKSQRILYVSFLRADSELSIYHLSIWPNLIFFFNNLQCSTFPTQSCLVLYVFCANLLISLIIWLIVSPHNRYFLFCCVLSIFDIVCPYSDVLCSYEMFWF